jgi:AraC family ethanolamine operon transcriptional activator
MSTVGVSSFCSILLHEDELAREYPSTPDVLALLEKTQAVRLAEDPLYAHRLRTSILRVLSLSRETEASMLPVGVAARTIYGALVPLAAAALGRFDAHRVEASRCFTKRLDAVRRCESYMHERSNEPMTLLDLSRISGMTSRSLTNAFEAVTGLGPADYLRRVRLSGAHRALLSANKTDTKITDVATAWGFWHMGHFAHYYRKMFGETPSQTLLNL